MLLISNRTLTGAIILTKVHYVTLYKECNVASFTHADMRAKFCIRGAECLLGHLDPENSREFKRRFSTIEQTMIFQKLYVGVAKIFTSGHSKGGFD